MKLPNDAAEAVFAIGERKFALFLSFALVEVEDHDLESGLLFRPGEVSCLSHTPGGTEPFDLTTAHLQPVLIEAANIDDAAASVAAQIKAVGNRVIDQQTAEVSAEGECSEEPRQECCGNPDACEQGQPTEACKPA
jgi:hypothetical protein